jgi:hypothetical protein
MLQHSVPTTNGEPSALGLCYALARRRARERRENKTVVAGNLGGTATTTDNQDDPQKAEPNYGTA